MEPVCDQGTQVPGQIVLESISNSLNHETATVLIDHTKRKIHYIDKDSLVVSICVIIFFKMLYCEF